MHRAHAGHVFANAMAGTIVLQCSDDRSNGQLPRRRNAPDIYMPRKDCNGNCSSMLTIASLSEITRAHYLRFSNVYPLCSFGIDCARSNVA